MKAIYSPKIEYIPLKDQILLKFSPVKSKPSIEKGRFKLWWDKKGDICQLAITSPKEVLEEFDKNLHTVKLGGIWKGIEITEEDIREARGDLLKKLEEKW